MAHTKCFPSKELRHVLKKEMINMANKLKNIILTSVDLVRAGANQQADICLFKSAEPPPGKVIAADDPKRFDDITEI